MGVEVFVEGLGVLLVSGEGVGSIESAAGRVVPAGTVLVPAERQVYHFAGVEQVGLRSRRAEKVAIRIVVKGPGPRDGKWTESCLGSGDHTQRIEKPICRLDSRYSWLSLLFSEKPTQSWEKDNLVPFFQNLLWALPSIL